MSGEVSVPEKVHSELGASVASRWMACPGSVLLCRQVPTPPSTSFAEEGTQAHSLAELCLNKGVDPDFFIGMEVEHAVVTEDMAEYVRVYVDHCRTLIAQTDEHWTERRFNLGALNPPGPMFGTSDFVAYHKASRTVYVSDLKYGQGVVVEAKGNPQLRYYALGALLSLPPGYVVEHVVMSIVQPRAMHADGVVRTDEISGVELIEFGAELMDAARKTMEPNAPFVPGEKQCRFCPASGRCPAQLDHAQELAQLEFSVVQPFVIPSPETIPLAKIVEFLPQLEIVENYIAACRAQVRAALDRGEEVPGYKLVQKRPTRKWTDQSTAQQMLTSLGYGADEICDMDLKSPAQIEKLLGKKEFAVKVSQLVVKESSGLKMAPASDPAPAVVISRGEEFSLLPSGNE